MTDRRPGLDLLRACAISFVVVAHGLLVLYPHIWYLGYLGHLGSYGVDLFFVLSGFLIGGILLRLRDRLHSPRVLVGFWLRRWLRTLPNYFLFVVVNVALALAVYRHSVIWRHEVLATATFTQSLTHPPPPFFSESWTLAIEEWFYLSFPLALMVGLRGAGRLRRWVWPALLSLMFIVPLLMRAALPDGTNWGDGVRTPMVQRLDSIAFGVVAATLAARLPVAWRRWRKPAALLGLIVLTLCYVQLFWLDLDHSLWMRTLWFDAVGMGFALLLPWAHLAGAVPADGIVRRIALWSYSLYLCNLGVLGVLLKYGSEPARQSAGFALALLVCFLLASVVISAGVYRAIERPILRARERLPVVHNAR